MSIGLRGLGHHSVLVQGGTNPLQYPCHHHLSELVDPTMLAKDRIAGYAKLLSEYDVFTTSGFTPLLRDGPVADAARKIVTIYQHVGTATRLGVDYRGNPIKYAIDFDHEFASTPDLLRFARRAVFIPNAVAGIPPKHSRRPGAPLRVIHCPTNSSVKGTPDIVKAMGVACEQDPSIEFIQHTGLPHRESLEVMRTADVLIDQFVTESPGDAAPIGMFGVSSVEAMVMGLTVINHLAPCIPDYYPGVPILNVHSVGDITRTVLDLAGDPDRLVRLGEEGRKYAERVHSPAVVAKRVEPYLHKR